MGGKEGAPHSVIYMAIYHLLIIKDLNNIIHTVGPFYTYLESLYTHLEQCYKVQ